MRVTGRLFLLFLVGFLFVGCGENPAIEGKVVDGKGKPVTNVKIIAKQIKPIKGYEQFETTTGSDGTFHIKGLFPTSEYILFASGEAEPQTKITVQSGTEDQLSMLTSDMVIRFTTPKDGVITDTTTGLQWAQDAGSPEMNRHQANANVRKLKIGGYSDWRLPTNEELESLLTYCKSKGIKLEAGECAEFYKKIGFKLDVQSIYYWSSTSYAYYPGGPWIVGMWVGSVPSGGKSYGYYVWPVRSGQ